jgi:hypothetical protein
MWTERIRGLSGDVGERELSNTFLILLAVADFLRERSKSAVVERWFRPANVEGQATARPASNGAREAEGVVMVSGVIGPMSSTRRKRAKETTAQSAENPQ